MDGGTWGRAGPTCLQAGVLKERCLDHPEGWDTRVPLWDSLQILGLCLGLGNLQLGGEDRVHPCGKDLMQFPKTEREGEEARRKMCREKAGFLRSGRFLLGNPTGG